MGTYTLRVPASRVGYVLEAQGGFSLGPHVQYVLATRTSLGRWVRTAYCGTPGEHRGAARGARQPGRAVQGAGARALPPRAARGSRAHAGRLRVARAQPGLLQRVEGARAEKTLRVSGCVVRCQNIFLSICAATSNDRKRSAPLSSWSPLPAPTYFHTSFRRRCAGGFVSSIRGGDAHTPRTS